ncbi:MAG: FAD-dependent oxidoreductase, partial [Pyrinomonadaceae bacterium]|nr:FAD-dependent oxidoreductase [Pyrinomonadaceae bacterium]
GQIGWLESLAGPNQQAYLPGNELAHLLTTRTLTQPDRLIYDQVRTVTKHDLHYHVATDQHGVLESVTVLVATGATPRHLDVPGAQRFIDRGLGYSVTTYAHLLAGKRVAVIGATARALSGAAELARTAERVFLIVPAGTRLTSPLAAVVRRHPNVEVLDGYTVREIVGRDAIEALVLVRDEQPLRIGVDRAFVALGLVPNSAPVRELVATDPEGFIVINAHHETSVPGVFAAGDVTTKFSEHVLVAIGDGARAAMNAYDYLVARWLVSDQQPDARKHGSGGDEPTS